MNHGREILHHRSFTQKAKWLTSPLLDEIHGLVHGFTVRAAGDATRKGFPGALCSWMGMRRLRCLLQVHGTRVARPDDPAARPKADAWVGTPEPGVLLGILTADCLPVLFCHPDSKVLALAHAGWRGAAEGVVNNTLKSTGVPTDEVRAVVGPGIGSCCYEVGEDVARAVGRQSPHLAPGKQAERFRLDLKGLVRSQLMGAGVAEERIHVSTLCTACRADLFFSYRRDGDASRLCAFLGWAVS